MSRYRLGVVLFMLLVITVMLYVNHRFRRNRAGARETGSLAPDFQLHTVDGKVLRLSSYRGKAVLLNFWATWCPPCRKEMPWFVDFQKEYGPQGLEVIGISVDGDAKQVTDFTRALGVDYPILLASDEVTDEYGGIAGLPTTVYIGRDGHTVRFVEGLAGRHEVEENIRQALATSNPKESSPGGSSRRAALDPAMTPQGVN